jgi:hypothetical protein
MPKYKTTKEYSAKINIGGVILNDQFAQEVPENEAIQFGDILIKEGAKRGPKAKAKIKEVKEKIKPQEDATT